MNRLTALLALMLGGCGTFIRVQPDGYGNMPERVFLVKDDIDGWGVTIYALDESGRYRFAGSESASAEYSKTKTWEDGPNDDDIEKWSNELGRTYFKPWYDALMQVHEREKKLRDWPQFEKWRKYKGRDSR